MQRNSHKTTKLKNVLATYPFSTEKAMKLVRAGADPDTTNPDGQSLLQIMIKSNSRVVKELMDTYGASLAKAYNFPTAYDIDVTQLTQKHEIGKGQFATVYHGEYHNQDVAIKDCQIILAGIDYQRYLANYCEEIAIMTKLANSQTPHPNIIKIMGYKIQKPIYSIILEYATLGSIANLIQHPTTDFVLWSVRENIMRGITDGMKFIHEHQIIHADIKSDNILATRNPVTQSIEPKIADFGLSHYVGDDNNCGSSLYKAPETLNNGKDNSKESDIFSLGLTHWEILVLKLLEDTYPKTIKDEMDLRTYLLDGKRYDIPIDRSSLKIELLITWCWHTKATSRPTAHELLLAFDLNAEELVDKLKNTIPCILAILSKYRRHDLIQKLIPSYTNVDETYQEGCTPFYLACKNGDLVIAKLLRKHHAIIHYANHHGETPCYIASANGHTHITKYIYINIKKDNKRYRLNNNIHKANKNGESPFWIACANGHLDTAKYLYQKNADPRQANLNSVTPFHVACANGQIEIINFLISIKADTNQPSRDGNTPHQSACANGQLKAAQLLEEVRAQKTKPVTPDIKAMQLACCNGHEEMAKHLIEQGYDIHTTIKQKYTLLYLTAESGQTHIVKLLFMHGAHEDINKSCGAKKGMTPLTAACFSEKTLNKPELFHILLENGASLIEQDDAKLTALDYAVNHKNDAAISEILSFIKKNNLSHLKTMSIKSAQELKTWVERNSLQHEFDDDFFDSVMINLLIPSCIDALVYVTNAASYSVFTQDSVDPNVSANYVKLLKQPGLTLLEQSAVVYALLNDDSARKIAAQTTGKMGFLYKKEEVNKVFTFYLLKNIKRMNPGIDSDIDALDYLQNKFIPSVQDHKGSICYPHPTN